MTTMSRQQVYAVLRAAGFDHEGAVHMVAIAQRESGFNIEARANYPQGVSAGYGPEDSIGLFQVNMLAHPQYDPERLATDPLYAAQAAYEISGGGTNFNPWTTNKGLSQADLDAARVAADEVDQTGNMADVLSSVPLGKGLAGASTAAWAQGGTLGAQGAASQDPAVQTFLQQIAQHPDALVRAKFPSYVMYLADPEMGPLLLQAAQENWDGTRLQTAIQNTNFWRTTSDAQRTWDNQVALDPAAADRQRQAQLLKVSQEFTQLGFTPDQSTLWQITNDSLRNGWNTQQITNAVVDALPRQYGGKGFGGGDISGTMQNLKASAADYFMPLSDDTAYDWAKRVAQGTMSQGAANSLLAGWAKGNYSWLAADIDRGVTLKDYFKPLQEQVATIMGTSPEAVDFMNDPFWHQLTGITDAQGQRRAPTEADAQALARSHPNWATTVDATNRGAQITNALQQTFHGGG